MSRLSLTHQSLINFNFLRLLLIFLLAISLVITAKESQKGVVIVSDVDHEKKDDTSPQQQQQHSAQNNLDALNPQLVAALRKINDDPSYLKPDANGEMVDLSQFQMDPQKLEEMIEIFDWISSQLPPDDPHQIQAILNHVEQHVAGANHTNNNNSSNDNRTASPNETDVDDTAATAINDDERLLAELTVLPEYLHQVDNGVDFMKMNGVPILLNAYRKYNPLLTEDTAMNVSFGYQISSQIMHVIGVATQNNPNAIQYTHQSQLVPFIVEQLNHIYTHCKRDETRMNGQLMNNLIFTLSSISRQSSIGLQSLDRTNGPKILYKCAKLMRTELKEYMDRYASDATADASNADADEEEEEDMENFSNLKRAFNKLLTMVSDIVVLNRNSLEYSRMFLQNNKWCYFMIDKGLQYHPDAVLQFVNDALERNYCVEQKMLTTLKNNLKEIIQQRGKLITGTEETRETDTDADADTEDAELEDDFDDFVLTQSTNLLRYIEKNFDAEIDIRKTEL